MDRIVADGVGKKFGRRVIFAGLNATFEAGEVVAVTGHNGSGKSTLLRILAGLLTPSFGRVSGISGGTEVDAEAITPSTGFVAPYLNVYDSFSARENLEFISRARRMNPSPRVEEVLARVGLDPRSDAPVSTYSSGMMQRVRLAAAVLHDPSVLMFDEPTSNLDAAGRSIVRELIAGFRSDGKLIILATNDEDEAAACDRIVCVADFPKSS
ncbi:MAG: ABC transporter ATP-binding protein [Rhodothermia bacterium]|nr:ABC transporter ATP-binding protein [Rhodothermia bacterium]